MQAKTETQKGIRWDVFIPCFLVIGGAAILGVVTNAWLTKVTRRFSAGPCELLGGVFVGGAWGPSSLITPLGFFPGWGDPVPRVPDKKKILFWGLVRPPPLGCFPDGLITYGVNEPLDYFGTSSEKIKKQAGPPPDRSPNC